MQTRNPYFATQSRDIDTSIHVAIAIKMPRSISNAASLRLASHQFHSSVFIVNCRLPESFDNVIAVTNGFITKECVGFNIDCTC